MKNTNRPFAVPFIRTADGCDPTWRGHRPQPWHYTMRMKRRVVIIPSAMSTARHCQHWGSLRNTLTWDPVSSNVVDLHTHKINVLRPHPLWVRWREKPEARVEETQLHRLPHVDPSHIVVADNEHWLPSYIAKLLLLDPRTLVEAPSTAFNGSDASDPCGETDGCGRVAWSTIANTIGHTPCALPVGKGAIQPHRRWMQRRALDTGICALEVKGDRSTFAILDGNGWVPVQILSVLCVGIDYSYATLIHDIPFAGQKQATANVTARPSDGGSGAKPVTTVVSVHRATAADRRDHRDYRRLPPLADEPRRRRVSEGFRFIRRASDNAFSPRHRRSSPPPRRRSSSPARRRSPRSSYAARRGTERPLSRTPPRRRYDRRSPVRRGRSRTRNERDRCALDRASLRMSACFGRSPSAKGAESREPAQSPQPSSAEYDLEPAPEDAQPIAMDTTGTNDRAQEMTGFEEWANEPDV